MTTETQWIINALFGVIVLGLTTWANNMWSELKALRHRDEQKTHDISALQILVVGNYVKRDELRDIMKDMTQEIIGRISHMEKKVDSGFSELYDELKHKVDKS